MLSRELALDEARKQKEALAKIGGWRRTLFLITATLAALAVFGFRMNGWPVLGAAAAIAAAVCFLLTCVVDLSIRNGRRNVKKSWIPCNPNKREALYHERVYLYHRG